MTPEEIEAAKQAAAAGGKGAKDGDSPTPEQLRAAQDAAETARKEKEGLQEKLDAQQSELDELNEKARLSEAEKKRKALLEAGIDDDEALIAELEAESKKGTRWVMAVKADTRKSAKEIAETVVKEALTEREYVREIEDRDDWLEEKAKERGQDLKKFKSTLEPFADPNMKARPMRQAKKALEKFIENEKYLKEKSDFEEEKRKNANFRDDGTSHEKDGKTGKVDFTKDWRAAKTEREKELAAQDI